MRSLLIVFACLVVPISCLSAVPIKVGVTAGPHAIIMEKVKELAKEEGIDVEVVEFNDFIIPNTALDDKMLDLNSYQHQPYLKEQVKSRGCKIKSMGKSVLMPLGIYSKKIRKLADLKENSKVAIPSDPTNGGRALKLLEEKGLIKLKPSDNPSILDITENQKKLDIIEIEAPQIPRTLEDVDVAIINTDWVVVAGLDPQTAIAMEDTNSPYANVFAVHQDETREDIERLIKIYQSPQMKEFITRTFKGAVVPAW